MKKFAFLILSAIFLSGCATYKFHHGQPPYDKGYVISRDDYTILEYTLGPNNTVPDRKLAKGRFLRRRNIVEDYYKRMGYIENRLKMTFMDPAIMFLKLVGGVFRLPFIAISDYRYEHNPKYREKIKKMEQEKDAQEEVRIKKLKEQLNNYIQKDLAVEQPAVALAGMQAPTKEEEPVEKISPQILESKEVKPEEKIPELKRETKKEEIVQKEEKARLEKQRRDEELVRKKAKEQQKKKLIKEEAKEKVRLEAQQKRQEELARKEELSKQKEETKENVRLQAQQKRQEAKQRKEELRKQKQEHARLEKQHKEEERAQKKAEQERLHKEKLVHKELRKLEEGQKGVSGELKAVIIAKPIKGFSPLKVHFYGDGSHSLKGRITSYTWDFGDGDTSVKANPVNTYYSGSFEPKQFNVTLTVTDNKGNSAIATVTVEVLNK